MVALAGLAAPPPAHAFPLDGCRLALRSVGADGRALSAANGPGMGGTLDRPFLVDPGGLLSFEGSTERVHRDSRWFVSVYGLPLMSGAYANEDRETASVGELSVRELGAERFPGLYFVAGYFEGDAGRCEGSGWIRVRGDPVGTPLWTAGLSLVGLGVLAAFWSLPSWGRERVTRERPRRI